MVLEWYLYILFVLAGFFAGIINTLAGNGSVFTLSLLLFSGMPAGLANGTNRLGAMAQCIVSVLTFKNTSTFKSLFKESLSFIPPSILGTIFGACTAIQLSDKILSNLMSYLMIFMLFLVIFKPKSWLIDSKKRESNKSLSNTVIFFGIGFYAGFIQMGMGILFLSALVLISKYSILHANFIKIIICTAIILPALLIYIYYNQVDWIPGFALAIGQGFGAWLATKYALENKNSAIWIRRLLVFMISLALVKLFNLHLYFPQI
jgi:hypothetical protein